MSEYKNNTNNNQEEPEAEKKYSLTAEQATSFDKPKSIKENKAPSFNRRKVLIVASAAFSIIVLVGFMSNLNKKGKETEEEGGSRAAQGSPDFLKRQLDRSLDGEGVDSKESEEKEAPEKGNTEAAAASERAAAGYPVSYNSRPYGGAEQAGAAAFAGEPPIYRAGETPPPPAPRQDGGGGDGAYSSDIIRNVSRYSRLTPSEIDGSLFSSNRAAGTGGGGSLSERYPYMDAQANPAGDYLKSLEALQAARPSVPSSLQATAYDAQNNQADKKSFYERGSEGGGGYFLDDNTIWIGSVIPGVLVTGINTDLPGDVIARVTQNVYDSRTGKYLLIPQGTILAAKYNSSISYAQSRVQIIWETLIRPDGFELNLGGMNGVDNKGFSGNAAHYRENYFQYLKAAGIITMFSAVSARMTGEAAKYQSAESAGAVAAGNAQMIGQLGGNIINRALDIQPTLTVEQGTPVNIMLNKNINLPPLDDYPVSEKYSRRKK